MKSLFMCGAVMALAAVTAYGALMTDMRAQSGITIPPAIEIVGISNGNVAAISPQSLSGVKLLTHDSSLKFSPVWSPDGSRIAFIRQLHARTATSHDEELLVIDLGGHVLSRTQIDYANALTWINRDLVTISDSINPSASYYAVINVRSGEFVERDLVDSFSGFSYSYDSTKYVRTVGCPHFATQSECNPDIYVNDKLVLSLKGAETKLIIPPVWSAAGDRLALVAYSPNYDRLSAIFVNVTELAQPRISRLNVPQIDLDHIDARWVGDKFYISGQQRNWKRLDLTWLLDADAGAARLSRPIDEVDAREVSARKLRKGMLGVAKSLGLTDSDAWCKNCPLSLLPRVHNDGSW